MSVVFDKIFVDKQKNFYFNSEAKKESDAIANDSVKSIYTLLANNQESEHSYYTSLRLLKAFESDIWYKNDDVRLDDNIDALLLQDVWFSDAEIGDDWQSLFFSLSSKTQKVKSILSDKLAQLPEAGDLVGNLMLKGRSPLALVAGCWFDFSSQAATQPAVLANTILQQRIHCLGDGRLNESLPQRRIKMLRNHKIDIQSVQDFALTEYADIPELSYFSALYHMALSRYPISFCPECIAANYVYFQLGLDEAIFEDEPNQLLSYSSKILKDYLSALYDHRTESKEADELSQHLVLRVKQGVQRCLLLESVLILSLIERVNKVSQQSLDDAVAQIFRARAVYAGKQHKKVRLGGCFLSESLSDPNLDADQLVSDLKMSSFLKKRASGSCRFIDSIRFGGRMFAVFTPEETQIIEKWALEVMEGGPDQDGLRLTEEDSLDQKSSVEHSISVLMQSIHDRFIADPIDNAYFDVDIPSDDRELFFRLVNIEHYPHVRKTAYERAKTGLENAQSYLDDGSSAKYSDATYFEYTPDALISRIESVYWEKLINPYKPLKEIPEKKHVVFQQKCFAIVSLLDGTWAQKIGSTLRYNRESDAKLFDIYVDEMGRGDMIRNHIAVYYHVLDSMDITMPHVSDKAFIEQRSLFRELYQFPIYELCLSQFPDSLYAETLGLNLAIEIFGLGEFRMHEIQKLKHWGFDYTYESLHLSIDNIGAGHVRESINAIISYLDNVKSVSGEAAQKHEWQRIWRGYASVAPYIEKMAA